MTWLEAADRYTVAAEMAKAAGDDVAFIALIVRAAECVQIARNLQQADAMISAAEER